MRKQFIDKDSRSKPPFDQEWLDVVNSARVELSSEEPGFAIESALTPDDGQGWRAAESGPQVIRLLFDTPRHVRHIRLAFHENEYERTQEFALRWSQDGGHSYREVVRQQYNFSPSGDAREVEEYTVDLEGLTALELDIVPDIARGGAKASLEKLLLG